MRNVFTVGQLFLCLPFRFNAFLFVHSNKKNAAEEKGQIVRWPLVDRKQPKADGPFEELIYGNNNNSTAKSFVHIGKWYKQVVLITRQ